MPAGADDANFFDTLEVDLEATLKLMAHLPPPTSAYQSSVKGG
jgi:hypothetical protein